MQTLRQIKQIISIDQSTFQQSKLDESHQNQCSPITKTYKYHQNNNYYHQKNNHYQELYLQIERLKRKISILEKNKVLLQEQLTLAQQEIKVQYQKVNELSIKNKMVLKQHPLGSSTTKNSVQIDQLYIILNEKQQYIEMISKQLKIKNKQIQIMTQDNQYLTQQISNYKNMQMRFKDSIHSQLEHYQNKIKGLQVEIHQKKQQNKAVHAFYEGLIGKEKEKYQIIVHNFMEKMDIDAGNMKKLMARYDKIERNYQKLKEEEIQWKQKQQTFEQTVKWYKKLVQQAKTQFIHTQLVQEQKFEKQQKQHKQKAKLQRILKMSRKQNRNDSNVNQSSISTKTHRIIRNNTQVASFD